MKKKGIEGQILGYMKDLRNFLTDQEVYIVNGNGNM